MDKRLLAAFFIFLGAFLVLPIAMQKYRQSQIPDAGGAAASGSYSASPASAGSATQFPELNEPPLLNEANLIGTEWQVQVEQYKIKVTLSAGGICYATHPLAKAITGMDYIEGRWRVENNKFFVSTALGGQEKSVELRIAGNNLYHLSAKGRPERVERFR
ncbi:MAG TPA: hypothetical protein PLY90_10960 [Candidatus Hydrogenedentes bacterium]|mgnify:CR=1 FL=1|jgi:hypothetical protein|nr:hypothetical protein [Candidatus Hydrogenedentota bacterium]HQB03797.1 hypothetical protein [Candidatus Hydrogenedentota bacterium]